MIENLTKENYWNEMTEKYPLAMEKFLLWINQYKKDNNWDLLFQGDKVLGEHTYYKTNSSPKFHDLPLAMQIGIFNQYCGETEGYTAQEYRNMQIKVITFFLLFQNE